MQIIMSKINHESMIYGVPGAHKKCSLIGMFKDNFQIESFFQTSSIASCHHGDSWTNKQAKRENKEYTLSHH